METFPSSTDNSVQFFMPNTADSHLHTSNEKNLQKLAILFGMKSNAYLQINRPIFAYSWLFLPIFAYLRICSKSPRIYFAFRAEYPCLFLPIFHHLTCESKLYQSEEKI